MFRGSFRRVKQGDRPSAAEWNRMAALLEQISSSLMANGMFSPGTGFLTRRGLSVGGGGAPVRLAKAQESAQDDQYISCRLLDSGGSETGDAFDVEGLIVGSETALNECIPRIVADDILPVFKASDGNWYIACLFDETPESGGEGVILVRAQDGAGSGAVLSCKKVSWDEEEEEWIESGDEILVYALFANASEFGSLNEAVPRIYAGDILPAAKIGDRYYFTTVFDGDEDCDCYSIT